MSPKSILTLILATSLSAFAAEHRLQSPDGKIAVVVSDAEGLRYSVDLMIGTAEGWRKAVAHEDEGVRMDRLLGAEISREPHRD